MNVLKPILVAATLSVSVLAVADDRFTEDDFKFDFTTNFHKQAIMDGLNHLLSADPRCVEIDPLSVRLDYDHGNPDNPSFAVTCGKGDASTTVFFTKVEAEEAARAAKKK